MFQLFFFSGTGAAYSCHKPRPPSPLVAVDSNVYSVVHVSQYELTFKKNVSFIYFNISVAPD